MGIAFEVLRGVEAAPPGWNNITGNIMFDAKMDFMRKSHCILDGDKTLDLNGSTYAWVYM